MTYARYAFLKAYFQTFMMQLYQVPYPYIQSFQNTEI